MKIKKLTLSMLFGALIISPFLYAGVYKGATDDVTFNQLLADITAKSVQLDDKISEAKTLGLTTDYAQVSQTTIRLFKDVFAPWDKANVDKVQAMYDAKYFSQYDPVGAKGLPFDELADSIEIADEAIAELQQQIDGVIQLATPPNFKTGKLRLNGPNYELDGNAVIAGKFFWQPNESDIMEAYGYGGEGYYSVQDLNTETTIKSWRQSNLLTRLQDQELNNRSPIQFFFGHIVPSTYWLRESYPEAFSKGSRLFTDYDIDNPNVKIWLDTLFEKQLSVAVDQLGDTERVHMIANEPTAPVQPWYVEGLIDVYLIGNYLHVANDFSILNMTLAEQESLKLKASTAGNTANIDEVIKTPKVIPIRMTQDRRMISREVHYFDHPYMGIIVQIRRHQRPELPSELPSETPSESAND